MHAGDAAISIQLVVELLDGDGNLALLIVVGPLVRRVDLLEDGVRLGGGDLELVLRPGETDTGGEDGRG